ncbi:MAG: tripartite tricarboxylate transporter substrate-binding protein [Alphaproteobacteria bacterium]|nr:tripartite tricarboxylate transporter substrate-binding protein [Alphaproteobacteria bacterium]
MTRFSLRALVFGIVATLGWAGAMEGATAAPDFKDKKINVIIGSSPGGGTDGTSRLVGRFLAKYLPGQPQMIYRNMPAGHGVKASNYFYNQAKPDGLTWFGGASSYVDPNNLRKKVVKYNPTEYAYIGAIVRGGSLLMLRKAVLKNLTDKSMKPVIVGTLDGSRSWAQALAWGSEYLGWNLKFVVGYPGSAALTLALRRGEIDMFGTSGIMILKSLIKTGKFQGLVQLGEAEGDGVVRRMSFPDVPTIPELMADKPKGIAKEAFDFWSKTNQIDKWYALPPKTPKDIAAVYRVAFTKATKDPEFIKFGRHQFSIDFRTVRAATIAELIGSTAYPKLELIEHIRQIRIKNGLPAARLSDAELAKLAKKLGGPALKVKAKLIAVKRGGRWLHFKNKGAAHKAKVSSSRSKVSIDGKKAKRSKLKPGMTCEIVYGSNGGEVKTVSCSAGQT